MTKSEQLRSAFEDELRKRLNEPPDIEFQAHPNVVLIVGVNGSGKTTTIAKLGKRFTDQGKSVLFFKLPALHTLLCAEYGPDYKEFRRIIYQGSINAQLQDMGAMIDIHQSTGKVEGNIYKLVRNNE